MKYSEHFYRGVRIMRVLGVEDFNSLDDLAEIADKMRVGSLEGPPTLDMTSEALEKYEIMLEPPEGDN